MRLYERPSLRLFRRFTSGRSPTIPPLYSPAAPLSPCGVPSVPRSFPFAVNPIQLWWTTTPRALRTLMAVVGGGWVLFLVASLFPGGARPFEWLALRPEAWLVRPWSLLTHSFVLPVRGLGPLLSVVFALLFLNQIGRDAEALLGDRWLMGAWLAATVGASVSSLVAFAALGEPTFVYGPWGAVLGLMMALGVRFPDKRIGLMFIGVVRLVYVAAGFVVVSMLLSGSVYAILPDLGALAGGALFGTWSKRQVGQRPAKGRGGDGAPVFSRSSPGSDASAPARPSRKPTTTDLDRILEKISAQGIDALTADERRVLEEASRG